MRRFVEFHKACDCPRSHAVTNTIDLRLEPSIDPQMVTLVSTFEPRPKCTTCGTAWSMIESLQDESAGFVSLGKTTI